MRAAAAGPSRRARARDVKGEEMAWFGKAADEPDARASDGSDDLAVEDPAHDEPEIEGAATKDAAHEEPEIEDAATDDAGPALTRGPSAPTVFLPEPLGDDEDVAPALALGAETAPALEWKITARPLLPEPLPRTPLQEKMAKIAEDHKDGPIEDMAGAIREALAENGREVPDEWILAIAEGLRQHGPVSLNLGGPGLASS